ncbi:hypothetical protein CEXT_244031, partial [Caerostris extrusa]
FEIFNILAVLELFKIARLGSSEGAFVNLGFLSSIIKAITDNSAFQNFSPALLAAKCRGLTKEVQSIRPKPYDHYRGNSNLFACSYPNQEVDPSHLFYFCFNAGHFSVFEELLKKKDHLPKMKHKPMCLLSLYLCTLGMSYCPYFRLLSKIITKANQYKPNYLWTMIDHSGEKKLQARPPGVVVSALATLHHSFCLLVFCFYEVQDSNTRNNKSLCTYDYGCQYL